MRFRLFPVPLCLGMAACAVPFTTSGEERKAPCDRIAAQAIQTSSLEQAKNLAARASECYASAQNA
jgi:hypothetical protein